MRHLAVSLCLLALFATPLAAASIEDLSTWTLIESPEDPGMSATIGNFQPMAVPPDQLQARLTSIGPVPSGTDIGYASVNGPDVANSTAGYYFDPATDFEVAIDFDLSTSGLSGGAGAIGFGIGEDAEGMDSGGVVLPFVNGSALFFLTAGRDGDNDFLPTTFNTGFTTGRLFVEYEASGPNVIVGVADTPGAQAPTVTRSLAILPALWDDEPLLVSFFLRSQAVGSIPALFSGQADATFSNFEVLSGTPIAAVPEPTALVAAFGCLGVLAVRRTRYARG